MTRMCSTCKHSDSWGNPACVLPGECGHAKVNWEPLNSESGWQNNSLTRIATPTISNSESLTTPHINKESAEPQAYGIIDPDYARIYTQARIIAWQYGYTCVMHGSFTRDLDLLLVPWTEQAQQNHEQLMKLIAQSCGLRFDDGEEDIYKAKVTFSDKPHGRRSCILLFPNANDRRWVDISIMPCKVSAHELSSITFDEAWVEYKSKGYQYNEDALEQVRFGWNIAHDIMKR